MYIHEHAYLSIRALNGSNSIAPRLLNNGRGGVTPKSVNCRFFFLGQLARAFRGERTLVLICSGSLHP